MNASNFSQREVILTFNLTLDLEFTPLYKVKI